MVMTFAIGDAQSHRGQVVVAVSDLIAKGIGFVLNLVFETSQVKSEPITTARPKVNRKLVVLLRLPSNPPLVLRNVEPHSVDERRSPAIEHRG